MSMINEHEHHHGEASDMWSAPPKTMFLFGFFAGIALCTSLALIFVVSNIASGKGLSFGGSKDTTAAAPSPSAPSPSAPTQPVAAAPVKPVDEKTDHIRGAKNAKVTLIEYSDFQCPFCSRHFTTLEQALKEYPNDVRLVYRHFPLNSLHPDAQKLAEASECAAEMGGNDAFWKYHDRVFQEMGSQTYTNARIIGIGKDIGLNEAKFKTCVDSGKYAGKVSQQLDEGSQAGVQGTPGTFVNGKLVEGAVPYAAFKSEIDAALKQ